MMAGPGPLLTQPEINALVDAYRRGEDERETVPCPPIDTAQLAAFGSIRTNQAALSIALFGAIGSPWVRL